MAFAKEIKELIDCRKIRKENDTLKKLLSPEMQEALKLSEYVSELEISKTQLTNEYYELSSSLDKLKKEVIFFEDALIYQDFGLYTPRYNFVSSEKYKFELEQIRTMQKNMIKQNTAISGNKEWTVDGSKSKGTKMINDMKKLLLRAFNSDCEDTINRVKYSNYDMSVKKIRKSADAIEKLGKMMDLHINPFYINYKLQELQLAFEYQLKKQEEKEEQKAARAELREAARAQKEIEEQRKRIEKEQTHYETALNNLIKQLQTDPANEHLLERKQMLEQELSEIDKSLRDIDYRQANRRAGYVYVISNVGSFGENIYKIGMTRRLNPQDRVDELGDASVPFNFDVHAMIFSDDAPSLEAALHRAFEDKKLNMVNHRREFFHVTLDEIKEVIRQNFDKTVEFVDIPDAEQFRISEQMRQAHPQASRNQSTHPTYQGEILKTKWGDYEMPEPYHVHIAKGPRNDLRSITY